MSTKRANYEIADFKAASSGSSGTFTAVVSVFGNVDLQGDRVMPGAFTKSLKEWQASGDPIPIIWSHDSQDPFAHIGYVTSAVETSRGLQISGKNDVDKPFAKQVHDLLVARRVKNWSFFYEVLDERRAKDGANELLELGLIEAGPTLVGANRSTDTLNAKSLLRAAAQEEIGEEPAEATRVALGLDLETGEKAGRRISRATQTELAAIAEGIRSLHERMTALMGVTDDEDDDGKSAGPDPEDEGARGGDTDLDQVEAGNEESETESPEAKSPDPAVAALLTRISEIRATTGITA